ncbi:hypothetical protein ATCC90586_012200 [Pythium insidiosum]|nr:hypothetical protein ATCC90586_012200 [Pythium insidiosum]
MARVALLSGAVSAPDATRRNAVTGAGAVGRVCMSPALLWERRGTAQQSTARLETSWRVVARGPPPQKQ